MWDTFNNRTSLKKACLSRLLDLEYLIVLFSLTDFSAIIDYIYISSIEKIVVMRESDQNLMNRPFKRRLQRRWIGIMES
jgi:hypothetical protein